MGYCIIIIIIILLSLPDLLNVQDALEACSSKMLLLSLDPEHILPLNCDLCQSGLMVFHTRSRNLQAKVKIVWSVQSQVMFFNKFWSEHFRFQFLAKCSSRVGSRPSLEKWRPRGSIIAPCSSPTKEAEGGKGLCSLLVADDRNSTKQVYKERFRLDIRKNFFVREQSNTATDFLEKCLDDQC